LATIKVDVSKRIVRVVDKPEVRSPLYVLIKYTFKNKLHRKQKRTSLKGLKNGLI
jgi:hypothetical protein